MKIRVKMVTGEEYTLSNKIYGAPGPLETKTDVIVQMNFLFTEMTHVMSDQGTIIVARHIVSAQIES